MRQIQQRGSIARLTTIRGRAANRMCHLRLKCAAVVRTEAELIALQDAEMAAFRAAQIEREADRAAAQLEDIKQRRFDG